MKLSTALFTSAALVLVISLLCIWFFPSGQDFVTGNTMWNGISSFASKSDAENIDSLDNLSNLPKGGVLVAVPYTDYTNEELARIKGFVDDGGTLLLMDDYGYGNTVLAYLGVAARFTGKPLLDPLFNYKNQWLPQATDFVPGVRQSGIGTITLDHATVMTDVKPGTEIAWSSGASFLDMNGNGSWDEDEPTGPFVVAAKFRLGKGTLTLVSDPSIMINSMLGRDDNNRFMEYLTNVEGGQNKILVDGSHLIKAPLDASKARLLGVREVISSSYALLGLTAIILVVISRYTLKKGETVG